MMIRTLKTLEERHARYLLAAKVWEDMADRATYPARRVYCLDHAMRVCVRAAQVATEIDKIERAVKHRNTLELARAH